MKKIIAINGSARKNWNTHMLLSKALEGAKKLGAETELVNLYDLNYTGCVGCLACKVKHGQGLGHCVVNDELKPILDRIDKCDGLILGSPIYLGDITGMMRAFWERLIFQYLNYDDYSKPFFKGTKKTAFIYTTNAAEFKFDKLGYTDLFQSYEDMLKQYFGSSIHMVVTQTLQITDYEKYHMALFNEQDRIKRRKEIFPIECRKAHELGEFIAAV